MQGVFGKPYIDIISFLDMETFDTLHPEICKGFVLSKLNKLSYNGNLFLDKSDQENVNLDTYNGTIKPLWYQYEEYLKLPVDHPIKLTGSELSEVEFPLYLKYVLGAYDPYQVFLLFTHDQSGLRNLLPTCKLFPNVIQWIDNNNNIFSHISKAYFLLLEADGISIEHCDPKEYPHTIREFIHIRSDIDRSFYVKDTKDSQKIYIDTRACYFNDQDWHGGGSIRKPSYTLRIDGTFTQEFKKKLS